MVRVTCLSPTKSYSYCSSAFAHMEFLIFNLRTTILLLGTIIRQTYKANKKIHLITIYQNKKRLLKSILKDRARCYGYESARKAENGTKAAIL